MNKFTPKSPDPYIKKEADMPIARFGHLNAIVDVLNQQAQVNTNLTAFAGGAQLGATLLVPGFNTVILAVSSGDSLILPSLAALCACTPCGPIAPVVVVNNTDNDIVIYPAIGEFINDLAVNIPITLVPGESLSFKNISCTTWQTFNASIPVAPGAGGYAEYVQHTQAPNNSIPPGQAIMYLTDNPLGVYDTIGITTATGPAAIGTAFQLPVGVYMVDYENSAAAASSFAIYQGASNVVLAIDTETISGSSTATTWIHGRAIITSAVGDDWIMISSVVGTAAIPTAGTAAGEYIARLTILKIG